MPIPLVKAQLIGTLVEGLFYGMYVVVFVQSLRVFYWRHKDGRNMWWLAGISSVIFVLITVYLVVDYIRVVTAFTEHTDTPQAALLYYDSLPLKQRFVRIFSYTLLTLITDAIIVYRTYVVWARSRWICLVPALCVLLDVALAIWVLDSLMQADGPIPLSTSYAHHVKYFYIVTLVVNIICSALISWKIWSIHRSLAEPAVAGVRFLGVMAVILESAAVYSCLLIALIATSVTRSYSTWIVLNTICPAIGMIFSTVMVRASRQHHTNTFLLRASDMPGLSASPSTESPVIAMRTLAARAPAASAVPTDTTFRVSLDPPYDADAPPRRKSATDIEHGHTRSSSPAGPTENAFV